MHGHSNQVSKKDFEMIIIPFFSSVDLVGNCFNFTSFMETVGEKRKERERKKEEQRAVGNRLALYE